MAKFTTALILVSLVAATCGNAPSYSNGNWKATYGPYGDVVHKTSSFGYDPSPYPYGHYNNKPSYAPHQYRPPSYGYNKYDTPKSYGSYSPS